MTGRTIRWFDDERGLRLRLVRQDRHSVAGDRRINEAQLFALLLLVKESRAGARNDGNFAAHVLSAAWILGRSALLNRLRYP